MFPFAYLGLVFGNRDKYHLECLISIGVKHQLVTFLISLSHEELTHYMFHQAISYFAYLKNARSYADLL